MHEVVDDDGVVGGSCKDTLSPHGAQVHVQVADAGDLLSWEQRRGEGDRGDVSVNALRVRGYTKERGTVAKERKEYGDEKYRCMG